jgi:putative ABC transport system permease protein
MALPLSYNWRNLFVRKLSTMLTFFVVAVVVLVLSVLLSFAAGIRASLTASGSPLNLIVLKPGATSESTSIILPPESSRVVQTPGVAHDSAGQMMVSYELSVQTSIPRKGPKGTMANVPVRGVDEMSFAVHDNVRIIEGQPFHTGQLEVIVGKAARDRYTNLQVGGEVMLGRLGNRICKVVGTFSAGGGAMESEIWAPRGIIADSFGRRFTSSVLLRMESPAAVRAAIDYVNGPTVNLEAKRETDYYKDLSSKTREIVVLTTVLVGIMAIGAVFAVANTMYAAVDGRRREIAMLRTIGFPRRSVMIAFVIESLLISTLACLAGLGASALLLQHWNRQDFLSDATWTVLAYELRMTPQTFFAALVMSILVGVFGAMAPALRAGRTRVIEALRKA